MREKGRSTLLPIPLLTMAFSGAHLQRDQTRGTSAKRFIGYSDFNFSTISNDRTP
jgi:hypothetical protein